MTQNQPVAASTRSRRVILAFFLAAAVVAGAHRWHVRAPASRLIPSSDRKSLPAMQLKLTDGTPWTLAEHHGQVILINYWATWCEPCQREMPALNQIAYERAAMGVGVLGISLDQGTDATERVRRFVARMGVSYPVAVGDVSLNSASEVLGIPNTLLVDRRGRLAKVYAGPIRSADVTDDLQALSREQ